MIYWTKWHFHNNSGLGFPWLVASIYWEVHGQEMGFIVQAAGLEFSTSLYIILAILGRNHYSVLYYLFLCSKNFNRKYHKTELLCSAISLIILRRKLGFFSRAELGGETVPKYISGLFLLILWILFVVLVSLQSYGYIVDPFGSSWAQRIELFFLVNNWEKNDH